MTDRLDRIAAIFSQVAEQQQANNNAIEQMQFQMEGLLSRLKETRRSVDANNRLRHATAEATERMLAAFTEQAAEDRAALAMQIQTLLETLNQRSDSNEHGES